jgi:hypothetical protein
VIQKRKKNEAVPHSETEREKHRSKEKQEKEEVMLP